MAQVITFRGTTIWNGATNGAGFSFRSGSLVKQPVENQSPRGVGYWRKPGPTAKATHVLDCQWIVANDGVIQGIVEPLIGLLDGGALVVPGYASRANCVLADVSDWASQGTVGGVIVSATLTFEEYP